MGEENNSTTSAPVLEGEEGVLSDSKGAGVVTRSFAFHDLGIFRLALSQHALD